MWAAVIGLGAAAPAQVPPAAPPPPVTRPAASQPDGDAGGETLPDEDLWREHAQPAVLTTAADVRALTPEQAAAGRPVRISGTVTYFGTFPPLMFVQDHTGAVCVSGPRERNPQPPIKYASFVRVEGVTAQGGDVAYVTSADGGPVRIDVEGTGRVSAPRLATVAQLGSPALHGETVEVEGIVRSVRPERLGLNMEASVFTIAGAGGSVAAFVPRRATDDVPTEQWVGAVVRARGVFNAATPPRQEMAAMRLLLRGLRDLRTTAPATAPDALPVVAIRTLSNPGPAPAAGAPRARVRGAVTLVLRGKGMFVEDHSGGVWVEPPATDAADGEDSKWAPYVRVGDSVDVAAFPGRRGWSTVLSDAIWWASATAAPMPNAPLVTAEQALGPEMGARLVRIEAMVLSVSRLSEHTTLVLQSGGRVFLARMAERAQLPPQNVSEGSWVSVSGVCVQTPFDAGWAAAAAAGPTTPAAGAPPSFHLLLASDRAVQVIGAPGWWTLRRVLFICGVLAAVALASIAWVLALRRRVARQTGMIREHLAKRALYEERVRIARELHDSLEQDLLGITMQLNATEKLLAQPERARQSLHLAAAMVRRSQAETHRAVWDLRDQRPGQDGIVSAIREAVQGMTAPRSGVAGNGEAPGDEARAEGPRVQVRGIGDAHPLAPQVENHLLRVALEAVTNAVKHARATRIDVEVVFGAERVEVRVSDDGRGFDAERLPPPSSGHFGLFGMGERAEKLGGELIIRSRPGGGRTEIRLVVPVGDDSSGRATHARAGAEAVTP